MGNNENPPFCSDLSLSRNWPQGITVHIELHTIVRGLCFDSYKVISEFINMVSIISVYMRWAKMRILPFVVTLYCGTGLKGIWFTWNYRHKKIVNGMFLNS